MAKTRLEKIAELEEKIVQIRNQQKQERQKHNKEERNARTRRLCSRHGLLEKMLPEIVAATDEQFQAFLEKTVANDFGRRTLANIAAQGTAPPAAKPHNKAQDNGVDKNTDEGNSARVSG